MTALDFPSSPALRDIYGTSYQWDGEKWIIVNSRALSSAETVAFLARTSGLDATHTSAYTTLIDGLVVDGIWSKLDMLHIYATQYSTTALLNLVSTSYAGVLDGSPTFTADQGFTGQAGTSKKVDTQFNPTTASSPKFTVNDAHISAWNLTNSADANAIMGYSNTGGNECVIYPKFNGDNNAYFRVNQNGGSGVSNSNATGFYTAVRTSSSATAGYRNGSSIITGSTSSDAILNTNIYVLGNHAIHAAGGYAAASFQCAAASIGSQLNGTEALAFYNRLRTYMTAVGVP